MQTNAGSSQNEMEEKIRKLQQMKQQEEEFDKHLAQTLPVSISVMDLIYAVPTTLKKKH